MDPQCLPSVETKNTAYIVDAETDPCYVTDVKVKAFNCRIDNLPPLVPTDSTKYRLTGPAESVPVYPGEVTPHCVAAFPFCTAGFFDIRAYYPKSFFSRAKAE